jgi:hypothetical protein
LERTRGSRRRSGRREVERELPVRRRSLRSGTGVPLVLPGRASPGSVSAPRGARNARSRSAGRRRIPSGKTKRERRVVVGRAPHGWTAQAPRRDGHSSGRNGIAARSGAPSCRSGERAAPRHSLESMRVSRARAAVRLERSGSRL